ncbi:hypothetical protein JHK87_002675 [Glycine soja]|nr:hypothetical protein JHK87_002675 [Glycine soja]
MERFCFFHRKTCHLVQNIVRKYLQGAKKHQQPVRYFSWLPHHEGIMVVVALAGKLGNGGPCKNLIRQIQSFGYSVKEFQCRHVMSPINFNQSECV